MMRQRKQPSITFTGEATDGLAFYSLLCAPLLLHPQVCPLTLSGISMGSFDSFFHLYKSPHMLKCSLYRLSGIGLSKVTSVRYSPYTNK
jgi:hypothetical protein